MRIRRQVVVLTLVASLVVGGTAAVAAYPMAGDTPQKMTAGQKIEQWAQILGITTQDKSIADLAREIREARQNMFKQSVYRAAAKLNIMTDSRDLKEITKDMRAAREDKKGQFKERLYQAAAKLNIATEGRDIKDIAKDVRQARLYKAAERLNVPTRDRTLEEIAKDVKAALKTKRENHAQ